MTPQERHDALAALGKRLEGRDLDCYATFGRDPAEPIVGEGDPRARICCFGRDPGRDEVRHGVPFVGAGGQKLRAGLHRALFGSDPPDFEASLRAGTYVFWANMVPFKPFENKAWPPAVLREFQPIIADLLVNGWQGTDVLTLGQGAFEWFALGRKDVKKRLVEHWARDDRFVTSISVELVAGGAGREVRLHPLPHPSPLNATWTPRFPGLLDARLRELGLSTTGWRIA
jgi:uracil-DNA glycosylase